MRPNFEIFSSSLADVFAEAGFDKTLAANPADTVQYRVDSLFDHDHMLVTVAGATIRNNISRKCLEHLERKFMNYYEHYAEKQQEEGQLDAHICTFRHGPHHSFDTGADEMSITYYPGNGEDMLFWLRDTVTFMPIVIRREEASAFSNWQVSPVYPQMLKSFRNEYFNTIALLMDAMEKHCILGNAVKMTYSSTDTSAQHYWKVGSRHLTSTELLGCRGFIPETNLLASCWKVVSDLAKREEFRKPRHARRA